MPMQLERTFARVSSSYVVDGRDRSDNHTRLTIVDWISDYVPIYTYGRDQRYLLFTYSDGQEYAVYNPLKINITVNRIISHVRTVAKVNGVEIISCALVTDNPFFIKEIF